MSKVRKIAERLFRDEHPDPHPMSVWGRRPQLTDLWECDQEKYVRRAEELYRAGIES